MSDLRSFEDKERMKGHGKELCRRIKLFRERPSGVLESMHFKETKISSLDQSSNHITCI